MRDHIISYFPLLFVQGEWLLVVAVPAPAPVRARAPAELNRKGRLRPADWRTIIRQQLVQRRWYTVQRRSFWFIMVD